jgi:hypothetical protein
MDCLEHVSRLGGDSERLDQNSHFFKDTGNWHEEALLFDRVLAEKTVGANDPTLAELPCDTEILPFLPARRAVRILTRASHCRDDEVSRMSPGHLGTDLYNFGQRFVTEDEFSGARRRRAVLEGADLAIRSADSHFDCSKQHLRVGWTVRYRPFHQAYAFFLWDDYDGAHLPGGCIRRSASRGRRFQSPHRDAGGRPVSPEDFQWQANDVVGTCFDSREVEPLEDHDARREENAVNLGAILAAANRQVIYSNHPNPTFGEHPRRARIKVGVVLDKSVHIPAAGGVVRAEQ